MKFLSDLRSLVLLTSKSQAAEMNYKDIHLGIRNISGIKKGIGFLTLTALLGSYVLTACGGDAKITEPTAEQPAATQTYTPEPTSTPSPTPTPEYHYEEVDGVRVPTNVYLPDDECIPFELQGVEKCVNMFVYGTSPMQSVPQNWQGIVHVIGDVKIKSSLTIEPGTEVYVAANSDIHNLFDPHKYDRMSGMNTSNEWIGEIAPGEPFRDEPNHITIAVVNDAILNINGTEDKPVLITSDAEKPTRRDWNNLNFTGTINYAIIEYTRHVSPRRNSVLSNSIIGHLGETVYVGNSNNIKILNNKIYDAGHELIATENVTGLQIIGNELWQYDNADYVKTGELTDMSTKPASVALFQGGIGIDRTSAEIRDNEFYKIYTGVFFLTDPIEPFILENNVFHNNIKNDIFCPHNDYCRVNRNYLLENNEIENTSFKYNP